MKQTQARATLETEVKEIKRLKVSVIDSLHLELVMTSGLSLLILLKVLSLELSALEGVSDSVLLDELDQRLERPVALVVDEGVGSSRLELKGGEARNLERLSRGDVVLLKDCLVKRRPDKN